MEDRRVAVAIGHLGGGLLVRHRQGRLVHRVHRTRRVVHIESLKITPFYTKI